MTAQTIKRAFNNTPTLISAAKEKNNSFAYGVKKFFYNLVTLGFGKSMETARAERRENEIVHVAFDVLRGLPKDPTDLDKPEFQSKTLHTNFDKDENSRMVLTTFSDNDSFSNFKTELSLVKDNHIYKVLEQREAATKLETSYNNWNWEKNKNTAGEILINLELNKQSTINKHSHQLSIMANILPTARQSGNFKDLIVKLKYLSNDMLLGIVKDSNINWSYAVLKEVSSLPQIHESKELLEELTNRSKHLPLNLHLNLQKKEQQVSTSSTINCNFRDKGSFKNMQMIAQNSTEAKELATLVKTINSSYQQDSYYEYSIMMICINIAQNPHSNLTTLQQLHKIAEKTHKNETLDLKKLLLPILIHPNIQKELWNKFSIGKSSAEYFNEIYPNIKDDKTNVALLAQNSRVSKELLDNIFISNKKNMKILVALASNPNIPKNLLDQVTIQIRNIQLPSRNIKK